MDRLYSKFQFDMLVDDMFVDYFLLPRCMTFPMINCKTGAGNTMDGPIPQSLQLLPLYSMSIQKCLALRGGNEVRTDERAYYHQLLSNMVGK